MSFSATLYNNSDDPRALNKTLGTGYEVSNIRPTESCDILSPTFILDYDADYAQCNYVVVNAPFNRSYFITDMKIDIGKKIVISCAVDVLQTYKEEIEKLKCNIIRQENLKEPYLPDPEYKMFTDFAPYTYMPKAEQIAASLADYTQEKIFIVSYVGGSRGGN